MWKCKPLPTQERLKEVLKYEKTTGNFVWCENHHLKGKKAGSKDSGYLRIRVDNEHYLAHRLAWRWMTGEDPGPLSIDHENRDGLDNRWENLRLANSFEQGANKIRRDVRFVKRLGKWKARVQHKGTRHYLGLFLTEEDALAAVESKRRELYGDIA